MCAYFFAQLLRHPFEGRGGRVAGGSNAIRAVLQLIQTQFVAVVPTRRATFHARRRGIRGEIEAVLHDLEGDDDVSRAHVRSEKV